MSWGVGGASRRARWWRPAAAGLAFAVLIATAACTEDEPAEEPAPAAGSIATLPDSAELVAAVAAASDDPVLTDDLRQMITAVALVGSLTGPQERCVAFYLADRPDESCVLGNPAAEPEILLWGDGHAAQWVPALSQVAAETGYRLRVVTKHGCPPLLGLTPWLEAESRAYSECARFNNAALAQVREAEPALVIVGGALRGSAFMVDGVRTDLGDPAPRNGWQPRAARDPIWQQGLRTTLEELQALPASTRVVVLGDTPYPRLDASQCLPAHPDDPTRCAAAREVAVHAEHNAAEQQTAEEYDATYLDPLPWLCADQDCPAVIDGQFVYRDSFSLGRGYVMRLSRALAEELELVE